MKFNSMINTIKKEKIVAILRNVPLNKLLSTVTALKKSGIKMFEVTLNSQAAFVGIRLLRNELDKDIFVGAGTVLTPQQAIDAKNCGAEFILTPAVNTEVLDICIKQDIPIIPGVLTPTDTLSCYIRDIKFLKLFPAADFPFSYIKNIKGPFDEVEFMAVGGVNHKNASEFLKQGFAAVGIGSWLADLKLIEDENWDELYNRACMLIDSIKSIVN